MEAAVFPQKGWSWQVSRHIQAPQIPKGEFWSRAVEGLVLVSKWKTGQKCTVLLLTLVKTFTQASFHSSFLEISWTRPLKFWQPLHSWSILWQGVSALLVSWDWGLAVLCCLKKAKSYSSFFPFSSVQKEQTQMDSDISVPAVVYDRKEKEGTSNWSAGEEFLHKKILVTEPLGTMAFLAIMRRCGGFLFCARTGRRVENAFCGISQSWVLNCDPHSVPHVYNPVGVTKHRITAATIGMRRLHLSLGLQYCLDGARYI